MIARQSLQVLVTHAVKVQWDLIDLHFKENVGHFNVISHADIHSTYYSV